ncbi:unnamed protein product [Malus baccata var. baccata]
MAKAEAIRARLVACLDKGFDEVQVELDSKELVDMISGITQPNVVIEGLLFDIKCIQMQLMSVDFIFAPRICNQAAHLVASFCLTYGRILDMEFV